MDEDERLDRICKLLGVRLEDIKLRYEPGPALTGEWWATVGDWPCDPIVGTGSYPDAAIEDFLDRLGMI
jgi:hypothetical protein